MENNIYYFLPFYDRDYIILQSKLFCKPDESDESIIKDGCYIGISPRDIIKSTKWFYIRNKNRLLNLHILCEALLGLECKL